MINDMTGWLKKLVLGMGLLLLAACVSTTDSRFAHNADKDEALRKFTELGLLYIQKGNTVDAMPPLKRALEIDPRSADVHAALALLFQEEKDERLAEDYFRKALRYSKGTNNTRIRNNYARFLFKSDRLIDACEQLKLASEDPFYDLRSTVFENLGVCYQRLGKQQEALAAYERALTIDESRGRALLEAAYLQFKSQNYRASQEYHQQYQRMVRFRMVPSTPKSLWLGVKLAQIHEDKNAEASYALKLRNLFPDSPENKSLRAGG